MTQKTERWIFVGACAVAYALAMLAVVTVIREPVHLNVGWLQAKIGAVPALAIILAAPIALWGFATWRARHVPEPVIAAPVGLAGRQVTWIFWTPNQLQP